MSLAKKTLEHPVLVFIIFALLCVVGLFTVSNIAIDIYPEIETTTISVRTTYTNAGPETVEEAITDPLESQLVSVSGLKKMTSVSAEGSSSITLEFDYGVNLDEATNDIRDKLERAERSLPDDVDSPTIYKRDISSKPMMQIAVTGNRTTEDLKEIADDYIQPVLEQASGVSETATRGGREKIIRVELSQNRLEAYGFTLTSVANNLKTQNVELGGGKITESAKNYLIRTIGEFSSIEEIESSVVGMKDGYPVKLSDIGTVYSDFVDETNVVYINGQPGVYVSVSKQSGSNSVQVSDAVFEKIAEVQATLPADIQLEVIIDDADEIRDTLSIMVDSGISGIVLAMMILIIFLRSMKSTLIIGVSVPISIMVTLVAMNFAGITLNLMTMTGLILGLGMVVDASIVILENIYTYRAKGETPRLAAVHGTKEVATSVLSGNLTTLCVFVPFLLYVDDLGMTGMMFKDIIFTVCIAIVSSLFVGMFLVPVLAGHFVPLSDPTKKVIRNPLLRASDKFFARGIERITEFYGVALKKALTYRKTTLAIVAGIFLAALSLIPQLNVMMMPRMGESTLSVDIKMPEGTTIDETKQVAFAFEEYIEADILGYTSIINDIDEDSASISIGLPEIDEQIDTSETIKTKLRPYFTSFPQATITFGSGRRGQMGAASDIDIAVRSTDFDSAFETAQEIAELMEEVSDLSEVDVDVTDGLPQVEVLIDRERAYSFGVSVSAVATEINACIDGTTAGTYREDGSEYDIVVLFDPEDRKETLDLESIFVNGTDGQQVALANFVQIVRGTGPVSINRENQSRIIHVTASIVSDTRADEIESNIKELIANNLILPDNVALIYDGSWQEISESVVTYTLIIVLAILLVFGVMAGTYESFIDPFINLLTIPLVAIGVVVVHFVTGQAFSMTSGIGIIMLVGIVVNNGIILVDYTNLLVKDGVEVLEACLQAGISRLRPVLMSTLTTALGMFPLCFATGGSAAMIQPIGLSVFGGLLSSTFITLLFVPVVYSYINKLKRKRLD